MIRRGFASCLCRTLGHRPFQPCSRPVTFTTLSPRPIAARIRWKPVFSPPRGLASGFSIKTNFRFDPRTFPDQIDILSALRDSRIIKPALRLLLESHSPAIRLQLLNSVCRSLGANESFYRLLSHDEIRRNEELSRLLRRASTLLSRSALLDPTTSDWLRQPASEAMQGFESANSEEMINAILEMSGLVRDGLSTSGLPPVKVLSVYLAILAIGDFVPSTKSDDLGIAQDIFTVVCLHRLSGLVREMGEG